MNLLSFLKGHLPLVSVIQQRKYHTSPAQVCSYTTFRQGSSCLHLMKARGTLPKRRVRTNLSWGIVRFLLSKWSLAVPAWGVQEGRGLCWYGYVDGRENCDSLAETVDVCERFCLYFVHTAKNGTSPSNLANAKQRKIRLLGQRCIFKRNWRIGLFIKFNLKRIDW